MLLIFSIAEVGPLLSVRTRLCLLHLNILSYPKWQNQNVHTLLCWGFRIPALN